MDTIIYASIPLIGLMLNLYGNKKKNKKIVNLGNVFFAIITVVALINLILAYDGFK